MNPKVINADDQMERPIGSLIWAAALLVHRAERGVTQEEAELSPELAERYFAVEEQMRQAYLVAIRLRSKEVVDYAASLGGYVTEQFVKENPFGVALVLQTIAEKDNG